MGLLAEKAGRIRRCEMRWNRDVGVWVGGRMGVMRRVVGGGGDRVWRRYGLVDLFVRWRLMVGLAVVMEAVVVDVDGRGGGGLRWSFVKV